MTHWFSTQTAKDLFSQCKGEMTPIWVERKHCRCLVAVMGSGLTKRGIIQGGVEIDETDEPPAEELLSLLEEVRQRCEELGCVYVETRNFANYSRYKETFRQGGYEYVPHYDCIIPIPPDREALLSNMHESARRQVKKAIRRGETWHEASKEEEIRTFYEALRKLYHRILRPLPDYAFFETAFRHKTCTFLITKDGGVMLAVGEDIAYEWYVCGKQMSTWAAMEWCCQRGISRFDTMGAGEPERPYSVRDFKVRMGGKLYEWGRFKIVLRPWVYAIMSTLVKMCSCYIHTKRLINNG